MTDGHLAVLRRVAAGVAVSRTGIRWFGDPVLRFGPAFAAEAEEAQLRHMAWALRGVLYANFFTVAQPVLQGQLEAMRTAAGSGSQLSRRYLF